MSPVGPENFYRLEEFPSFISSIKCFGRPIIPPLVTPSRRHELKQFRAAAANKEAEKIRKKEFLNQRQDIDISSMTYGDDCRSGFQYNVQKSCALWYPSFKDCQEGFSVAISKLPTSGIYSSVHTGAIVCSNVIENGQAYTPSIVRDSLSGSGTNVVGCLGCSHNDVDLECSLCQAEYNQSFHSKSFTSEISPEVPCRTFSLLQQNVDDGLNDELNCSVEETEGESLSTVVCNENYVPLDTDSESNTTCMTVSTDLEKYMTLSSELSGSDNLAFGWDSRSVSQQYVMSRSDDASSETIVNTENELTPCASTMAELTDNIEDELSNSDETAVISDKELVSGTLKRAHSVDSYMKMLQTCAKNMNVRKSLSDSFNAVTNASNSEESEAPPSFKTRFLIKEDSKESEESKDMPEKDISDEGNDEDAMENNENSEIETTEDKSFQKKHVRKNSYTLDQPSSALILAHADCTCNFDANCISPHCSALKNENDFVFNPAFTKEKVEVEISLSQDHIKKLPILSSVSFSEAVIPNKEDSASTVIDVFPIVKEDNSEKSSSGNTQVSETALLPENTSTAEIKSASKVDDRDHSNEVISEKESEFMQCLFDEFKQLRKQQLKFFEEQSQLFIKVQNEFEERKRFLCEKLKQTDLDSFSAVEEKEQVKNDCFINEKIVEDGPSFEKNLSISNSSISSDQIPTTDKFFIQNSELSVSSENSQPDHSPSKNLPLPENPRASVSPSKEFQISPSRPLEDIKAKQLFRDCDSCVACNLKSNEGHIYPQVSESMQNGFISTSTSTFLSHCNSPPQSENTVVVLSSKNCDNGYSSFCDKAKQCQYCTYASCDYDFNFQPEYIASPEENSVSNSKDFSSENNFFPSQTSSGIHSKALDPNFDSCHHPTKALSSSSKKSDEYISTANVISPSFKDVQLPSSVNSDKNTLSQPSKEQSKLSVNSIISMCSKALKNGSIAQEVTTNKIGINNPVLLKKFEKLPAFVKGYLTRRLFKTERVQNLIKTLQDTALLIEKLGEDLTKKGDSVSERDVDFHRQLIVQLMTTFNTVYDIFCTISTKERMIIIAESRKYRQKLLSQKEESNPPVTSKVSELPPSKKHNPTSATLKKLERERSTINNRTCVLGSSKNTRSRSTIEMTTYTIDDLEHFRGRSNSSMSSKNRTVSPSSIYKSSIGLKKKPASAKSSGIHRNHKWVP